VPQAAAYSALRKALCVGKPKAVGVGKLSRLCWLGVGGFEGVWKHGICVKQRQLSVNRDALYSSKQPPEYRMHAALPPHCKVLSTAPTLERKAGGGTRARAAAAAPTPAQLTPAGLLRRTPSAALSSALG